MTISTKMIDAIKVQFKRVIDEDSFVEKGMKAWLTDVEWDDVMCCYNLYFDFLEFEDENRKYFKQSYRPNGRTPTDDPRRTKFTAIEAGYYSHKLKVPFYLRDPETRDDKRFQFEIAAVLLEL